MASTAMHSRDDIARFLGTGETRLIAAGYRDPDRAGELYILPDGDLRSLSPDEAAQRRRWVREELRCMFDDCPAPTLRAVARANRRDGFSHGRGAGGHSPESQNHRQGKAVVAAWLRERYPDATVVEELASDTQRSNVADVMLLHPSGRRVAFEVQYAQVSVAEWRERHESYARQGIIDVWLWGHTRVRKSPSEYAAGPYRLSDVQDEVRRSGSRVTFLNPETAQIAVATGRWDGRACLAYGRECSLHVENLVEVIMSERGLSSRTIAQLARASDERDVDEQQRAERAALERQKRDAQEVSRREQMKVDDERWALLREKSAAYRAQVLADKAAQRAAKQAQEHPALTCRKCGERLDPILAASGVHVYPCRPRQDRDRRGR
ncbi:hypothetical protein JF531_01070 [Microbacterium esteraromaticum]|uniref:competence protein CoiA family protein n=1 Tax=Microbacterium esteraromaticum TaxID=57043 RepID=UPI001A8E19D7|nr:competence protein CoiA family protein [Microbacterium esteraromaticum]MBN8423110.1 hypothetical protein [Microbacterium esteraromaticum]